jgi:hypothetical protein
MTDVFVLGAGLSAAVSTAMPVMRTLAEEVISELGPDMPELPASLPRDDFETWLSYLADDQPWLAERRNLTNRAAFLSLATRMGPA